MDKYTIEKLGLFAMIGVISLSFALASIFSDPRSDSYRLCVYYAKSTVIECAEAIYGVDNK